jgi:uncharacterized protein
MHLQGKSAIAHLAASVAILVAIPVAAQNIQQGAPGIVIERSIANSRLPDRDTLNASTVSIITAPVGDIFPAMGSDMARVLDDGDNLRVLPVIGKGSVQNLIDIMLLKNIDMGFVVSDAIDFVKTEYGVPSLESNVRYIAKLFNNDIHIVARRGINSIGDLQGKRVFAERNMGYFSARNIFDRLNISADIDSNTDDADGLQRMLDGEADAWIVSAGTVAPIVRNIQNSAGRFHLVSIPYDRALQDIYLPSSFSDADYPNLVAPGEAVQTVAASTLLMVYAWPEGSDHYNRVAKFVDALFGKIGQLQQPTRNPKWRETSLSATVPGLQRFKAADDWLAKYRVERSIGENNISVDLSPAEQRAMMLRQFHQWLDGRPAAR